ncbi:LPD38 domain-containing protein [Salmonella enterica subsp. diarizonae]
MPLIPDVRPEAQKTNPNRTGLNIAQPGEQPAFDYDSYLDSLTPENVRDYSTGANLKDYGIAAASGAANLPEGAGALANFGGQWLEKKAGELSPDHFVAKSALSDIGSFLHKSGRAVQEGVGDWKQQLESGYSQPAKNALEQGAAGSISGLTLNLANVFGDLGATVLTGGLEGLAAKGATAALLKREAVSGLVRKGLTEEAATKVADDAMEIASRKATAAQAGKTASKYGFIASGTADAQGNTAAAAAQGILNASPQQLAGSPTFVNLYQSVQSDPQYAHLSDEDKVQVAKEQLADRVGMSLATDPKLLAVNIASTMMGDKAVADMALNGVSKSIAGGFAKGALRDGVMGGLQSGYSQYAQNVARDEDAGIATDHMQGVAKATGEGTLLGGIIGGGAGTVSGIRGRRNGVSTEQAEKLSGETPETPAEPETTTPADPIEAYRQQFSGLSRDELLQHYANADFAPEGDADAVYRKHAANGLLRDMDRADQVKGIVDEMRSKPRGEVLEEYRTLSEKEKRNDADEMRLDAAREVLRPQQPEAETRPQQTAEPQKQEPSGRRSQYDPDDLDIPAFMRDPRFRDFTDEPTEVQQHLTRGNAPTPEDLVHEQMAKGDAGPTDYELAERPRLPSPGDIHPGQGYPLPGEVRHMSDESPAGRGGRYTTTGEVQGQSYQKGRQTVAPEGVQRQGETFQGEQSHRELPAPERQELPRPEEPGLTSHEQGGMAVKEGSEGEKNPLQKPEKAGQQQISTEKSGEKIDDFGEVIHGAAKHRRAALAEELNTDKTADDYKTQPLSKLFPKPDYEKMAAEGTDNKTLAMLALLRSMIPAKPRVAHRLNRWAKQVEEVRDTAGQLLDGSLPADKFIDRIRQERGSHYGEMVKTWEMLHRLSPAQLDQAAGYRVKTDAWSMFNGKEYNPPKVFHTLENEKGRRVLDSDDLNDLHKKAKAYFDQQAASPEPADSKTKLDIYQNRRTGEVFIAYGKNKTSLQGGFKTVAEARDYAKTRRAELLEKLNKLREQSREEQRNTSNRDRTGPERHEGNVTPETFSDAFGFRGVQFGNYVEGPRRQSDLNRAYDSLMDMADVLKVPAKALSLNGRLGLAFGARGKGGKNAAAAHYEPDQVAINLTKGNGAGSLAHEWFHALDNYFGQNDIAKDGNVVSGDNFMTGWNGNAPGEHPVRREVHDAFKGVVRAISKSGMAERARRLDEVRSKPYWSTDIEMAARAFERYVQDKAKAAGVENDFLVNIRKADDHGSPDTYAYPTQAELDGGIRQAFDHLFSTLKTRETDKGVAFYSRKGVKRTPEGNFISDTSHSKEAKGSSVAKVKAVARGVMDRIRDNTLNVRVVKSQAEAQELAGESFDGYGKVHAFYRPDEHEIVLVADNIPDGRTVREKLRHEIIHHAMEQVVTPAEYKTIVDNVLKTRNSDNAAIRETWRRVDADYGNESPEVQAGEFLAHMAEKEPGKLGAAWNRVVALIKAVLRRTGLFQPSDLNDIGYVRDTIRTLGQRVREGYVPREGGDVSYSRTGKPDPFRVPEGEGERYRRDLSKMMSSLRSGDLTVQVGRTPPVLRNLGAPDLPVSISRDIVRKAINDVQHHVEMDTIEKLPELMHDPLAVYESATQKNALVLWLDAVDRKRNPVLAAVHMNNKSHLIEINRIASVYGTDGGMSKINKMERDGLALYRSDELNPDGSLYRGLQLPKGDRTSQGSDRNILSPDDIRKGPYYSRSGSDLSPEETLSARFVRAMQDKFQVLKAVQDNIRKSGGKLDDSNDAYLAEELFHGKAENDLNVMKERYVKPLAKLLAEYDIPQSALDEYLYARHAPERNAHIAEINPKMPDGGSGMTNAEAAGIMDRVRRSGKQAQYDRLAGIVDDMLARRRELIKSAGLESEGTVDAWQDAYKHYVPLKGQDADGTVLPRTGRGYVIGGKESKMAMGRKSKAQSPSTQAMQDLTASLIRNRKNEVGNAFLKLVQDNPDKDYWQVFTDDKPDTTRRIVEKTDPETGEKIRQVEEMPVPMAMMSDKYFTTKKDGKTYYIKLHDERLMRAMKNMGPETGNAVIQTLARVNRFMSAMNTSLNPEFLVSNFIRDMQTAVMNLKAEQGRDDGKLNGRDIAMKTVRDSGIAMKAVYASLRDKSLSGAGAEWQKTWKEFVEDGAKTGWFRMEDLNGQMKEMDRLVTLAKGGWQGQGIQSWHSFTKLVEDANNAVENALRLSAYKHARDAGISRAQAASLAKNMTVNFNRRGEQGILLNSLYMFANASIQGTANMMRSLAHLNGEGPILQRLRWKNLNMAQKLALTATGAGYLLASLNRAGAGQDGDGENWYDKVPDYVKEHNIVIMKSLFGGKAGEYWSIPLPYGYNMFYLLGSTAEGVTRGNMTASKAAGNIVGGMLGAFNPLGSEDSKTLTGTLFKNAAPTILRPVADLWANENFMGTQIYQENFPGGTPKPESTLGRRSTPETYKAFAGWLNRATGGSQYRSGAVDINPDVMKYWIDYVSGGMGRFAGKTIDAAAKSYNGIDIPPQQIPFLGKISGKVMPYADQQAMYEHIDELRQYDAELKTLRGADRTAFLNKYRGQISMNGIIHQSQTQLKNLRKQRDEIYSDPTLTARQQAGRVLMVEQNMKKVVDRFNREYREKVGE